MTTHSHMNSPMYVCIHALVPICILVFTQCLLSVCQVLGAMLITVAIGLTYSLCLQGSHNPAEWKRQKRTPTVTMEWESTIFPSLQYGPGVMEAEKCTPESAGCREGLWFWRAQAAAVSNLVREEVRKAWKWAAPRGNLRLGVTLAAESCSKQRFV